jgi:hypothetical protein
MEVLGQANLLLDSLGDFLSQRSKAAFRDMCRESHLLDSEHCHRFLGCHRCESDTQTERLDYPVPTSIASCCISSLFVCQILCEVRGVQTDHVHRFDRSWSNISPGKQVERSLNCSRSSFSFLSEVLGPDASEESISLSGWVGRGLVNETVLIKTKSSRSRVEAECTPYAVTTYIASSRRPELSYTVYGPGTTGTTLPGF